MREQIDELIRKRPRKEDCPYSPYEQGGKHYSPFVRNPLCGECLKDQILSLISGEIEKVENPYPENRFLQDTGFNPRRIGFEHCRQRILTLLRK